MNADIRDIEDAIRCTGFYRIKAKRLKSLATHVIRAVWKCRSNGNSSNR